jgi:hypothetical protein
MDDEHVPLRSVEPGEDEELVAGLDAVHGIEDIGLEDDPRVRRALVTLLRSGRRVRQRRLDPADCPKVEGQR